MSQRLLSGAAIRPAQRFATTGFGEQVAAALGFGRGALGFGGEPFGIRYGFCAPPFGDIELGLQVLAPPRDDRGLFPQRGEVGLQRSALPLQRFQDLRATLKILLQLANGLTLIPELQPDLLLGLGSTPQAC